MPPSAGSGWLHAEPRPFHHRLSSAREDVNEHACPLGARTAGKAPLTALPVSSIRAPGPGPRRGSRSLPSSVGTSETLVSTPSGTCGVRLRSLCGGASLSYRAKSPRNRKFSTGGGGGRTSSAKETALLRQPRPRCPWLPRRSREAGLIGAGPWSHEGWSPSRGSDCPTRPSALDTRPREKLLTSCGWDDRGPGAGGGHRLLRNRRRQAPAALPQAP